MAMIARRSRSSNVMWAGFVDALAALLMVIMFLLTVFMLAQFFLNELLTGRDAAMTRLERQINELSELLALESQTNADLRLSVAQLSDQLQSSTAERDTLSARLGELTAERDSLATSLARMTDRAGAATREAERVRAELADAFKVISADKEKIEVQLSELESLRRDIVALKTVRKELEDQVGTLAANLRTREEEAAGLSKELTASRDRSKELEARLAGEEERTRLAQKEVEKRDIRLRELLGRLQTSEKDLAEELELSASQRARIDLLARQIAALRQQLARIIVALEASEAKAKEQGVRIVDLGRRLNLALAGKVEELSRYRSEFFGRLREVLGNHPGIRVVGDRFVFQSEVLFA
ncbi:MAG: chemotaxis protein, partial [Alphaproteobacteria bacterium]